MQETPQMPVGRLNTYDDITNRSPIGIEGKNKPARWKAGLPRHGMFQCYSIPVKRFSAWITNWWIIITTKNTHKTKSTRQCPPLDRTPREPQVWSCTFFAFSPASPQREHPAHWLLHFDILMLEITHAFYYLQQTWIIQSAVYIR